MLIRSFLRGAFSCFLVSLLLSANFCHADEESTVEVVGLGECADCDSINLKNSQAFSGLRVTIDCKVENGEMKRRGSGVLDEQGNFKVNLPNHLVKDEKLNEECYAQLHSASAAPCPTHNGLESSKVIFKTKNNGKHTFGLKGKLKFSPVTCASLTFWHHHFNYPPLPQLPPLKSFHHHPYFPPKVYYPPKQLPPPVPEYKPPPTPEYKPPPKALPPPAPEYKPPPKVVPPPEKKPCPPPAEKKPKPPVYKPTPKPPVYKPTPKPPVYKPTPKPPVYTPTPKPPVYTPTPKPPVYKPPVYTPTPKPPAYNPKPKPPVYLPPHVPIYKPYPKKPCPPLPKLPPFPKIPPKYFHHPKFGKKWPPLPPHYPIH